MSFSFFSKMRSGKFFDRFKRKISVTEMTGAPHPSLDDFLGPRDSNRMTDDGYSLSMRPACQEGLQARSADTVTIFDEEGASETPKSPVFGLAQLSWVCLTGDESQMPGRPTSWQRRANHRSAIVIPRASEDRRASQDPIMASPSALVQAFQGFIPEHPAIFDLPPPINRHSDPTYKEGPAKRAEIVWMESQHALKRRCSDLDDEAEKLAARLEETEKELNDTTQHLDNVIEELATREEVNQDLQTRCAKLEEDVSYRVRQHNALLLSPQDLVQTHANCAQQEQLDRKRIQSLLECHRHRHCKLRHDILHLSEQLSHLEGIEAAHSLLQYEVRALRQEHADFSSRNEQLETHVQNLQVENEELTAQLHNVQAQRSSDEDVEATQLAEREVFVMHERLRTVEKELKQRRTSLEVVRQNNRDLAVEISCLKHRLGDKRAVRRTV